MVSLADGLSHLLTVRHYAMTSLMELDVYELTGVTLNVDPVEY